MVGHSIISVESPCLGKAGDAVISDLSQNVNEVSDIVFTGIARNDKVWVLEVIVNALIRTKVAIEGILNTLELLCNLIIAEL